MSGGGNDLTDSLIMHHKQRIREGVKPTGGSARNATECVATVQQGEDQGWGYAFLFTIGPRKVFIYNRTSKSLWIQIFFPPELVIVPFRLMFLKLEKKNHGLRRKKCAPHGPHIPVGRGFSEEYEEMGEVFCRGFFY